MHKGLTLNIFITDAFQRPNIKETLAGQVSQQNEKPIWAVTCYPHHITESRKKQKTIVDME